MIKLYDYIRSSASMRVRIALSLKKISYETIPIHLLNNGGEQFSDQYKKINPQQLVPTLIDDAHIITQSLAIVEYLNDTYPIPPLLPASAHEKALVRSFALSIVADIHPLNNLRVLQYLKNELNISDEQKNKWYQHWMEKGLSALENRLTTQSKPSNFCFGDTPTIADICLIPQLFNAKRFNCDLSHYKRLQSIDTHCLKLDAFINALPKEPVT